MKKIKVIFSIGVIVVCVMIALFVVNQYYTIHTVTVEGNISYTNEEIIEFVMNDAFSQNSLYLTMKYKVTEMKDIPFIEMIDIKILSPDSIKIICYEKSMAGYVEHLGRYLYFDKDGIVIESTTEKVVGIPQITGLTFEYIVLYEVLPISNTEVFQKILDMTQLLEEQELNATKIHFDSNYEVTLYFDEVRVKIGVGDNLNEKIVKLKYILPELEGKSGILRMEDYTSASKDITFELN
ncbi:MAG: cell division protein FtsQ/DivIB [Eubacteriales bacterium]